MSDDDDRTSVRPGSNHDLNGGPPVHEDPDDPHTAAGYLMRIHRRVGLLTENLAAEKELRRAHAKAIEANARSNRDVQTAVEAQGRSLEHHATETRGTLAAMTRAITDLAADIKPISESRKFWGSVWGRLAKSGITIGGLIVVVGAAIKVFEAIKH